MRTKKAKSAGASEPALLASLDSIRASLKKAGLRKTAPRVAVLRGLLKQRSPVSHSELVELLASEGFDSTTIYRNLKDLTDAGLVSRRDLGDHTWRFELQRPGEAPHAREHAHFLCEDCGAVACLDTSRVNISAGPGAPRSVGKGGVEIQVKGRCDRCT